MVSPYFYFPPGFRDITQELWRRYDGAVLTQNVENMAKYQGAIEQLTARTVRDYVRRGQPDGNIPTKPTLGSGT